MATERHEDGFIPGIHNYCDRWCERCAFSSRCRAYAIEMTIVLDGLDGELSAAAADLPPDPAGEGPGAAFMAELEEEVSADEVERERLRRDAAWLVVEAHPLLEQAKALAALAQPLIEAAARRVGAGGPEAGPLRDPLEVLSRYRFFVQVKVHRALLGREEEPLLDDDGQPIPSDADGSAKIAHLTCAAAREAARRLGELDPKLAPLAAAYARTAERVLQLIDRAFPGHRTFRRPGFDDATPS